MIVPALLLAVALDSVTFLWMGMAFELNPAVVAAGPAGALALRWTAVAAALAGFYVARKYRRVIRPALLVAAYVSAFGAASNLAVLGVTR